MYELMKFKYMNHTANAREENPIRRFIRFPGKEDLERNRKYSIDCLIARSRTNNMQRGEVVKNISWLGEKKHDEKGKNNIKIGDQLVSNRHLSCRHSLRAYLINISMISLCRHQLPT